MQSHGVHASKHLRDTRTEDDPDVQDSNPRRVKPRHFHAAWPALRARLAAEDATGGDEAGSVVKEQPRVRVPILNLYQHALQSVFGFLSMCDLSASLRVCRGWKTAALYMGSLEIVMVSSMKSFLVPGPSALARHIREIGDRSDYHGHRFARLNSIELGYFKHRCTHLQALFMTIALPLSEGPVEFPADLRTLGMCVVGGVGVASSTQQINGLISAIGQLKHLENLELILPSADDNVSFAALEKLSAELQWVAFTWANLPTHMTFSQQQFAQLRALLPPSSGFCAMQGADVAFVRNLIGAPNPPQWKSFGIDILNDEMMLHVTQMPNLTTLDAINFRCSDYNFMHNYSRLEELSLGFQADANADAPSIHAFLFSCEDGCFRLLQRMALRSCSMDHRQMETMLRGMPTLQELAIEGSSHLESFNFLSAVKSLSSSLTRLCILDCSNPKLSPKELMHVRSLRALKVLILGGSLNAPLDSFSNEPSILLPALRKFTYLPPAVVGNVLIAAAAAAAAPPVIG